MKMNIFYGSQDSLKITEGGPKTPPPIKNFIPEFISLRLEFDSVALPYEKMKIRVRKLPSISILKLSPKL